MTIKYRQLDMTIKMNENTTLNSNKLRAIDLFAGIGGIRLGFSKAFGENIEFVFSSEIDKDVKVKDILEKKVDEKYTISDRLWAGHQRRKVEHKEKGNGFGYSIFNGDSSYTSTISARYYKDGSEILIEQQNKNPRKLAPREAGKLQGFPNNFKIVVSDVQAYKQFGNSVSVPVIESISRNIMLQIKRVF